MSKTVALILACGTGSRFQSAAPKQYLKLANKTILEHSIVSFSGSKHIDEIICIINKDHLSNFEEAINRNLYPKLTNVVFGGETRQVSSYLGLQSCLPVTERVLIHDAARPFVSSRIIDRCLAELVKYDGVCPAVPATDTVYKVSNNLVLDIPDRQSLAIVQTPQCFKYSIILKAHQIASENQKIYTDDCSLIFRQNLGKVSIVEGEVENIKVTTEKDLIYAEKLLAMRLPVRQ